MLDHLVELFRPFVARVVVVAHPSFADAVRVHLRDACSLPHEVVEQQRPTGMLDAILQAVPVVGASDADRVWIAWCDQVGLLPETLERVSSLEEAPRAPAFVFPTVRQASPYIHFSRDAEGRITGVLQRRENDAMPDEGESDMGMFAMSRETYLRDVSAFAREVVPGTGTAERNFLPFIPWLASRADVVTTTCTDPREAIGVNTPEELRFMEEWLRSRTTAR